MRFTEAVATPRNDLGATGKRLAVIPHIYHRPVQISPGQGLPTILAIVGHPRGAFKVPGRANDRRLVGPHLSGFGGVFRRQNRGQPGESLQPQGDLGNRRMTYEPA